MRKTIHRYSQWTCAALATMAVCHVQNAYAGAYGVINGTGKGWTSVNMRAATNGVSRTNAVITPAELNLPSASVAPSAGYTYSTNSPLGASTNSYARSKATSLGGWQNRLFAATGDGVDGSPEFEARLNNLTPATCAELAVDTVINQQIITETSISGSVEVTTKGSAGTAVWLRGFEYTGTNTVPADDLNTPANETIEFLKANGTWKFENLIVGPFDFGSNDGCPLLIPFTINTTNIENLVIALDTMAKSTPFVITCPSDVTFKCGEAVKFPAADVTGGCGQITGTWTPEETNAFPVGIPTPVTVTVTDENGDTASCTFNVTVTDTVPPQPSTLPILTYSLCNGSPGSLPLPTAPDACSGTITGKTTNVFPPTTLGTNVITWTFDDGNDNVATANQTVIVTGLTFAGFYAPINGTGGSCTNALVTKAPSSTLPIKFDLKCGNTFITTGTPPKVHIQLYSDCDAGPEIINADAVYQNNWHYNWNVVNRIGGVYKITIDLPDGTSQFVFVKLK